MGTDATTIPDSRSTIMVVDDEPENLRLMEDLLGMLGYGVRAFAQSHLALAAAAQEPPDLILMDITMPDMDGLETCRRLKANSKLSSIPVVFLSAHSDTSHKVEAFRSGGVDYVTKPFHLDEVHARVEMHIQLQRARRVERDLLEKTLNGALRTFADLVHLAGPALAQRSDTIRSIVVHIAARLRVDDPWQYELAATLCLIGCLTLPPDAFERAYGGEAVSEEEQQMFRAHPVNGSRLLAHIPRLERVSAMIRQQQADDIEGPTASEVEIGTAMLRLALALDRRMFRGIPFKTALAELRLPGAGHPARMLEALGDYVPRQAGAEIKRVAVRELAPSMIVEDPIVTEDGNLLIIQKGTTLNLTLIERVRNFAKTRGVCEPIRVRVERPGKIHGPA
jgi:DNA-binding response OmpR family regulator